MKVAAKVLDNVDRVALLHDANLFDNVLEEAVRRGAG